jgi:hypothetical protein
MPDETTGGRMFLQNFTQKRALPTRREIASFPAQGIERFGLGLDGGCAILLGEQ